jgi:hypothetical protein
MVNRAMCPSNTGNLLDRADFRMRERQSDPKRLNRYGNNSLLERNAFGELGIRR